MIGSDNSTLQQRPKTFDAVGMDLAAYVFASLVIYAFVPIIDAQPIVDGCRIRGDQLNLVRDHPTHEPVDRMLLRVFDNLTDDASLTADRANHGGLAGVG